MQTGRSHYVQKLLGTQKAGRTRNVATNNAIKKFVNNSCPCSACPIARWRTKVVVPKTTTSDGKAAPAATSCTTESSRIFPTIVILLLLHLDRRQSPSSTAQTNRSEGKQDCATVARARLGRRRTHQGRPKHRKFKGCTKTKVSESN